MALKLISKYIALFSHSKTYDIGAYYYKYDNLGLPWD